MKTEKKQEASSDDGQNELDYLMYEKRLEAAERIRNELSGRQHSDSVELLCEMREERG